MPGEPAADGTALLRQYGLHVTTQRMAVWRAVSRLSHQTAEDIEQTVRVELGTISRQSVYDILAALAGRGLVRRIEPAGSPARYEVRVRDNHHHLICRACRRTVDVDCAVGEAPCLTPNDDAGFEIDEAEVIYWGQCPDCAPLAAAAAGGDRKI